MLGDAVEREARGRSIWRTAGEGAAQAERRWGCGGGRGREASGRPRGAPAFSTGSRSAGTGRGDPGALPREDLDRLGWAAAALEDFGPVHRTETGHEGLDRAGDTATRQEDFCRSDRTAVALEDLDRLGWVAAALEGFGAVHRAVTLEHLDRLSQAASPPETVGRPDRAASRPRAGACRSDVQGLSARPAPLPVGGRNRSHAEAQSRLCSEIQALSLSYLHGHSPMLDQTRRGTESQDPEEAWTLDPGTRNSIADDASARRWLEASSCAREKTRHGAERAFYDGPFAPPDAGVVVPDAPPEGPYPPRDELSLDARLARLEAFYAQRDRSTLIDVSVTADETVPSGATELAPADGTVDAAVAARSFASARASAAQGRAALCGRTWEEYDVVFEEVVQPKKRPAWR